MPTRADVSERIVPFLTVTGCLTATGVALALALAGPASLAAQAGQPASGVSVDGAVLTTGVQDHMPVDTLSVVPADVGRVFLWTRITGARDSTSVLHVWYRGEEEAARVEMPVESPDWRTYSTKRLLPSWTGPWRVEITDASGRVVQTVNFTVRAAAGGGMAADTAGRR